MTVKTIRSDEGVITRPLRECRRGSKAAYERQVRALRMRSAGKEVDGDDGESVREQLRMGLSYGKEERGKVTFALPALRKSGFGSNSDSRGRRKSSDGGLLKRLKMLSAGGMLLK